MTNETVSQFAFPRNVPGGARASFPATQSIHHVSNGVIRMAATLNHELRTPLNAILGSISLLEHLLPEGSHERRHVERMKRNSGHLIAMLDDVVALMRAESAGFCISSARRQLASVVDEALADVELQAGAAGVAVVNTVPGAAEALRYWGDERRVRQILVNLLTNAIKFTAPGGRVTMSGGTSKTAPWSPSRQGPWVFVRVDDTGRGIPPGQLAGVFEPFQQVQRSDRRRGEGLGLAISRHFARRMDGDITLESDLGQGASFTLWLPTDPFASAA